MAGFTQAPAGRGGRRPLDANLNLVPFIDLLSCCISFLLITAVWVNLAQMNVRPRAPGPGDVDAPPPPELSLYIDRDGYRFAGATPAVQAIPLVGGDYDERGLHAALLRAKQAYPQVEALTIKTADGIAYQQIIRALDQALRDGDRPLFPSVALADQGGGP